MRTFVALPLPEPWITPLMRAQSAVRGGRPVDADDLHVTLAFLDDQPEDRLDALHEALEAKPLPAAALAPRSYSAIGTPPRMFALDLDATPGLTALHTAIRSAARTSGIALPRDRFRPHVTLRRFTRGDAAGDGIGPALERLGPPDLASETARLCALWSSVLTPQGPIYDVLASYPLREPAL
ncbi:RNA 2',3'-cyclic phosphodiesterase [Jannaschia donghaensis]|uniref:RNA 2',3'-cyclic phosphodiesterase n=1 Tax=Jannaschia donghaensis TaxID=420998 RepID=A0A0M6YI07_9RHOB|nr:RNA 2',3'-cyclic phosphodiesterase [Jannaschia donghaensis]CTQ49554.1 2'-5' RNA ligase [Jannaschia donghaensis]